MRFIHHKVLVYISRILLIFLFSMGTAECLHHDFSSGHPGFSTVKSLDTKSTSIQQYQLNCELCKSVANHFNSHFYPSECTYLTDFNPSSVVINFDFCQAQYTSIIFQITGRGPPAAIC